MAERYSAFVPIRAKHHLNLVAYHHFDVMQAHLAGQVGQNLSAVFQFNPEFGVRKGFNDRPHNFFLLWLVQFNIGPLKISGLILPCRRKVHHLEIMGPALNHDYFKLNYFIRNGI